MSDLPPHLHPPVPRGAPAPELDAAVIDRLFQAVAAETVDRAPTWRERLSQWPTPRRQALVVVAALAASGMWLSMMGHRDDLVGDAAARFAGLGAVLVATALISGLAAVRGLDRRLPSTWVVAAALLVPAALGATGLFPGMHTEHGATLDMHMMCGMVGTMFGALVAAPQLLVQRARPDGARTALIAASAGASAFVVQNLICPLADVDHLVFAHGAGGPMLLVLMLAGIGAVAAWSRRG
jgi:hypothetical protein